MRATIGDSLIGEKEFQIFFEVIEMFKNFIDCGILIYRSKTFITINELVKEMHKADMEFLKIFDHHEAYVRPLTLKNVESVKNERN